MKEKSKKLTQDEISALFCAVNEKNITCKSILEEIQPLIEFYFHGESEITDDCLIIKLLNGQKIKLSAASA